MIPASPKNRNSRPVEIAAPQLPPEPVQPSDPMLLLGSEEVDGALFRTADFSGLCREHLSIRSSCFAGCSLAGAQLSHVQCSDVLFRNCDLSNADFSGCSLHRVRFVDCRLSGANFAETTARHLTVERCKGEYLNLSFSRFRAARFAASRLNGASFSDCRFEQTEFTSCDLSQSEFFGTRLCRLSLADSEIRGLRVREIGSFELKGLKISALQVVELARLLGVEIEP